MSKQSKALRRLLRPVRCDGHYVQAADGLRVVAVFLVAWFHIWQQSWLDPVLKIGPVRLDFNGPVRTGYMMVDVMLLLSGFLLFLPYARTKENGEPLPDVRKYFIKRAVRIVPSYLLCVLVMLFVYAIPGGEYSSFRYFLVDFLGHLTFTHNLTYQGYIGTHLNGVLWTLAVEVQFYLLAPLIGRAFVKKPFLTYGAMLAVAAVYRFAYVWEMQDTALHFNRLPAMLDVYANGMLAAWAVVKLSNRPKTLKRPWAALIALAVCVGCVWGIWRLMTLQSYRYGIDDVRVGQMVYRYPLSALAALFLTSGSVAPVWFARLLSNRPIRFLSAISYNMYIWHSHLALRLRAWHIPPYTDEMPQRAGEQPWQTVYTWLCFAVAIAFAALVTYAFEKPMSRWGTKFLESLGKDRKDT